MEDDRHLNLDLLRAVSRGDRRAGDVSVISLAHLLELCPTCREAFEAWRRESGEGIATPPALREYDRPFDRARERLGERTAQKACEADRARSLAEELLALSPEERQERVRRDPARFARPELADLLLTEARERLPGRSREAYALAVLAQTTLQAGSDSSRRTELYARALAHQGNALRVEGELKEAEPLLRTARFLLSFAEDGDALVRAELDKFEGTLRRAQRQFDEAELLLARAVETYQGEERHLEAAQTLLALAAVYRATDRLDDAVRIVQRVQDVFEDRGLERSLLLARHNLAFYCQEAGRTDEARAIFERSQELYERFPEPWTQLRRMWLEGHLARGTGDSGRAEEAYRTVRDGFLRQGVGYDAALAALDLATLYAEQGRTGELKRLAEEIVPVFEAQDIHREASAALLLFQDAVRAEQVTLRYVIELSRYMEQARLDPSLAFRLPV